MVFCGILYGKTTERSPIGSRLNKITLEGMPFTPSHPPSPLVHFHRFHCIVIDTFTAHSPRLI